MPASASRRSMSLSTDCNHAPTISSTFRPLEPQQPALRSAYNPQILIGLSLDDSREQQLVELHVTFKGGQHVQFSTGDHDKREGGYRRLAQTDGSATAHADEEIENLKPHHGLVIEGPADIADQLRVVSSQGEPALPVFYVSGDGAQHRARLGSSFDPERVVHVASMVMRDAAVTSLARALRQSADDLLATSMMPTATILPSLPRQPLKRVARR